MLRRNPTALTISPEDLAAFEESHVRRIAHLHYQKTGEDPNGCFTQNQQQAIHQSQYTQGQAYDPNDELKPLPGDKARIVRSREERIVGASGNAGRGG